MRLVRKVFTNNWKYILTELILIFVGIYLALSLNNWNESKKIAREKESVVQRLEEEINTNLKILEGSEERNVTFFEAFERYGQLSGDDNGMIQTTEANFEKFKSDFPEFFTLIDKQATGDGKFQYKLSIAVRLDNTELRDIAWSTAKSAGFSSKFSYSCMLDIEDTYRNQERYRAEMEKVVPYALEHEYSSLSITCILLNQFQASLQKRYKQLLLDLKNCQ